MARVAELNTMRGQLEYLVEVTGVDESELMAQAVARGLAGLVRQHVLDSYLDGHATREEAVAVASEAEITALDRHHHWLLEDWAWAASGE